MSGDEPARPMRPPLGTLLRRAMRLRCPRCGQGRLFVGWFTMPERCEACRLKYERAPGYFLGSTYVNYGLTTGLMTAAYLALHFGLGLSKHVVIWPLAVFCIAFPLASFRHARALWLAFDCHFDTSTLSGDE